VLDNALWSGRVIDPADQEEDTQAIRAMNDFIASDRRVQSVMLAISDGITIVRKRSPDEMSA
jgi:predicted O-methyltransferase YrrM